MLRKLFLVFPFCILLFIACSEDDDPVTPTGSTRISFSFSSLEPLEGDFLYEAWAVIDGYGYSMGKFNINQEGAIIDSAGNEITDGEFLIGIPLSYMQDIGITIEPKDDDDTSPTTSHILGGTVSDGSASLTVDHETAIGVSFDDAAGKYIIATPTNGSDSDEKSGIWFIDLSTGLSVQGLTLPDISSGWLYEGWVTINGQQVSTGKFTGLASVDSSSTYCGSGTIPSFPGEDFLQNAPSGLSFPVDLSGAELQISIEPEADNSTEPFFMKLLRATIPADASDHTTYTMEKMTSSLPSGTAVLVAED